MLSPAQVTSDKHRILLVDDHPILQRGLAQLLEHESDIAVQATAASAAEALAALRAGAFELAVVDISLRGVSGIDLLKDMKLHWPKLPVLVLSMHDELLYAERALRAGARGYVMKSEKAENIVRAVRRVLGGHLHVSEAVNGRILSKVLAGGQDGSTGSSVIDLLSNRELEVFRLIGRGSGTRVIAEEMHVSVKTVETYRAHIKEKLKLSTAPELMRFAVEWVNSREG